MVQVSDCLAEVLFILHLQKESLLHLFHAPTYIIDNHFLSMNDSTEEACAYLLRNLCPKEISHLQCFFSLVKFTNHRLNIYIMINETFLFKSKNKIWTLLLLCFLPNQATNFELAWF